MKIDINADIGEGCLNEKDLFSLISSCNIACGGHFGDTPPSRTRCSHLMFFTLVETVLFQS